MAVGCQQGSYLAPRGAPRPGSYLIGTFPAKFRLLFEKVGQNMSQREYRFITDPEHKENLSGRVRAACANCRRKKIKCSGTVPCRICEDKGRVCEGLLPTDGAKSGLSPASSSSSAKVTKAQRPNAPGKKPSIGTSRRPSLKPIGSDESADSGYISNAPQPQSTVQTVHSPVAGGLYSVSGQGEGADGSDAMSPASALSDMAQGAISMTVV